MATTSITFSANNHAGFAQTKSAFLSITTESYPRASGAVTSGKLPYYAMKRGLKEVMDDRYVTPIFGAKPTQSGDVDMYKVMLQELESVTLDDVDDEVIDPEGALEARVEAEIGRRAASNAVKAATVRRQLVKVLEQIKLLNATTKANDERESTSGVVTRATANKQKDATSSTSASAEPPGADDSALELEELTYTAADLDQQLQALTGDVWTTTEERRFTARARFDIQQKVKAREAAERSIRDNEARRAALIHDSLKASNKLFGKFETETSQFIAKLENSMDSTTKNSFENKMDYVNAKANRDLLLLWEIFESEMRKRVGTKYQAAKDDEAAMRACVQGTDELEAYTNKFVSCVRQLKFTNPHYEDQHIIEQYFNNLSKFYETVTAKGISEIDKYPTLEDAVQAARLHLRTQITIKGNRKQAAACGSMAYTARNTKTQLCRNFKLGKCNRGDSCFYSHDTSLANSGGSAGAADVDADGMPKGTCKFFYKSGYCNRRGCTYRHCTPSQCVQPATTTSSSVNSSSSNSTNNSNKESIQSFYGNVVIAKSYKHNVSCVECNCNNCVCTDITDAQVCYEEKYHECIATDVYKCETITTSATQGDSNITAPTHETTCVISTYNTEQRSAVANSAINGNEAAKDDGHAHSWAAVENHHQGSQVATTNDVSEPTCSLSTNPVYTHTHSQLSSRTYNPTTSPSWSYASVVKGEHLRAAPKLPVNGTQPLKVSSPPAASPTPPSTPAPAPGHPRMHPATPEPPDTPLVNPDGRNNFVVGIAAEQHGVILFDPGANLSIARDKSVLQGLHCIDEAAHLSGLEGERTLTSSQRGFFSGPLNDIQAYYFPKASANLVSHKDLRPHFHLEYNDESDVYIATHRQRGHKVLFQANRSGHYVYRRTEMRAFVGRLINGKQYTQAELDRAQRVIQLHKALGHPHMQAIGEMLKHGAIITPKNLNRDDIKVAEAVHGPCQACLLGKMIAPHVPVRSNHIPARRPGERQHCDLMFITSPAQTPWLFFLAVDEKTGRCGVNMIPNRDTSSVTTAFTHLFSHWKNLQYPVTDVRLDREGAFIALQHWLISEGVRPDYTQAEGHVHRAERMIRTLKNKFRASLLSLPYKLPHSLYPDLMAWVAACNNYAINVHCDTRSPHQLVTGQTPRSGAGGNVEYAFGEVIAIHKTNATSLRTDQPRGDLGIVVGRDSNTTGGYRIYLLETKKIVVRKLLTRVTVDVHITQLLGKMSVEDVMRHEIYGTAGIIQPEDAEAEHFIPESAHQPISTVSLPAVTTESDPPNTSIIFTHEPPLPTVPSLAPTLAPTSTHAVSAQRGGDMATSAENTTSVAASEGDTATTSAATINTGSNQNINSPEGAYGGPYPTEAECTAILEEAISELQMEHVAAEGNAPTPTTPCPSTEQQNTRRVSQRANKGVNKAFNYMAHGNISVRSAIRKNRDAAYKAIATELKQMFKMRVWKYVRFCDIERHVLIIPCSMFLKEKYDALGEFIKLKARLVAGGNWETTSGNGAEFTSPTAHLDTFFLIIQIAAAKGMCVRTIDVTGAYLHALLPWDKIIYMVIDIDLTEILCELDPTAKEFVFEGRLYVRLEKCLYGLKESAREWYELVKKVLVENCELTASDTDGCLFKLSRGGKLLLALLYVDDILFAYNDKNLYDGMVKKLTEKFENITESNENDLTFIGMHVKVLENGDYIVSQRDQICKIINGILSPDELKRVKLSPGVQRSRREDVHNDDKLTDKEHEWVLSQIMTLMYIALRARPDILFATVECAARVKFMCKSLIVDVKRIAMYMNTTKEYARIYKRDVDLVMTAYADASFDVHYGSKGHTGIAVWLDSKQNSAAIMVKSNVQKTPTVSSMESELVALHEATEQVCWLQGVVEFATGCKQEKTAICQDNQANVLLNTNPHTLFRGRSRFIDRKYFNTFDKVLEGRVQIKWTSGELMWADALTKTLPNAKSEECRRKMMGSPDVVDGNTIVVHV